MSYLYCSRSYNYTAPYGLSIHVFSRGEDGLPWMVYRAERLIDGCMDEWTENYWMDELMNGLMNG